MGFFAKSFWLLYDSQRLWRDALPSAYLRYLFECIFQWQGL